MNSKFRKLATVLMAGAFALGLGATAGAQDAPPPDAGSQQAPQNNQGVARISYIHGDVSTQHSGSNDWAAATLNTPVVSGDRVSTSPNARAEIQLDHSNILRLSGQTTANVVSLAQNQMQVQIGQGLVNYNVLRNNESGVEIDTPNVAIRPQMGEGSYRILVNSDNETIIDVRRGAAQISTPQGSTTVQRDQRITVQGTSDSAQYQISGAPGRDDWDRWNNDRDRLIEGAASWRHTNPYYTGTQDLDSYGHWTDVPDYGPVWFPSGGPDWAPYRDGRWVWEPYYGWTWVSYEPWGWAPYHYGRWFVYDGDWGWWPGPVYVGYHPLWAPAYVSFFGFGGGGWGVSVGLGFGGWGSIGWLPCGPGDRFYPWYGRGGDRVSVTNITNVTNVTNVTNIHNTYNGLAPLREGPHSYSNVAQATSNEHVRAGFSSMEGNQFGRGRVSMQQSKIDAGSLRQASMMTGAHPVGASRESFRPVDRPAAPSSIPNRSSSNQRFFTGNEHANGSVHAGNAPNNFNRPASPANPNSSRQNTGQQNSPRPGFSSFGQGNNTNVNRGPASAPSRPANGPNSFDRTPHPSSGQNAPRPGFQSFGQGNNAGVNRGPASTPNPGQRGSNASPPQSPRSVESSRPGWRPFTPPSGQAQSNSGGRTFEGQSRQQPRPNYSQPPQQPERGLQNNPRGGFNNSAPSRPTLNMHQPVVTPRGGGGADYGRAPSGNFGGYRGGPPSGGSYPSRTMPSAPSRGNYGGGGFHGEPSGGGGPRGGGGYSGGGSRGGGGYSAPSGGGGHASSGNSSGHNNRR